MSVTWAQLIEAIHRDVGWSAQQLVGPLPASHPLARADTLCSILTLLEGSWIFFFLNLSKQLNVSFPSGC